MEGGQDGKVHKNGCIESEHGVMDGLEATEKNVIITVIKNFVADAVGELSKPDVINRKINETLFQPTSYLLQPDPEIKLISIGV